MSIWGSASDIVIIEHDVRAKEWHINELEYCPYIACAFAYTVYPVTTGEALPRTAHANRHAYDLLTGHYDYIKEGDQWADHAGFGLTKLGRLARQEIGKWDDGTWIDLDTRVSAAMYAANIPYHIHWPEVDHDHK
jgi:hypothetical protein